MKEKFLFWALFLLIMGTGVISGSYLSSTAQWTNTIPAYQEGYDVQNYKAGSTDYKVIFNEEYISLDAGVYNDMRQLSGHWISNSIFLSDNGITFVREVNSLIEFDGTHPNLFTVYKFIK